MPGDSDSLRRADVVHRVALTVASAAVGCTVVWLAWRGADYYMTPPFSRARHPLYWDLKPGGRLGLFFGYLGAGMMTLLLLYSVRKRVRRLRGLGSLSKWLHWHIFLGIYGPLFIVLHSSLKVGGMVSVAFWSMLTVALSGLFGRFLYLQIPRRRNGHALSLEEIERRQTSLTQALRDEGAVSEAQIEALRRLVEDELPGDVSLIRLAFFLPWWIVRSRWRVAREIRTWEIDPASRKHARSLARQSAVLRRRLLLLERLQRLFHAWHVFHKPFAVILYLLLVVHVAVAWVTGYGRLSL